MYLLLCILLYYICLCVHIDILPNYERSEFFSRMETACRELEILPVAHMLQIAPPNSLCEFSEVNKTMLANAILIDCTLYKSFLKYLQSIMSSENLLCARSVDLYAEMYYSPDTSSKESAKLIAWQIYKFFVAPGSSFEIGKLLCIHIYKHHMLYNAI